MPQIPSTRMTIVVAVLSTCVAIYWIVDGVKLGIGSFTSSARWGPYIGGGERVIVGLASIFVAVFCWSSLRGKWRKHRKNQALSRRLREKYMKEEDPGEGR